MLRADHLFVSPRDDESLRKNELDKTQLWKGIAITVCFVVLRLIVATLWNLWFGGEYQLSVSFLVFLSGVFLVMSVGLVYLGFTRGAGMDLKAWWIQQGKILGDITFRFGFGVLMGWLKMKRGILLAAGIVHGFIG